MDNIGRNTTGVQCDSVQPFVATGNIVYSPDDNQSVEGNCLWEYSLIKGGVPGTGNISDDPLVVSDLDYHLQTGSPRVNKADPASTLATDIDRESRPQGGRADIGADEVE